MTRIVSIRDLKVAIVLAGILRKPKVVSINSYLNSLAVPWSVFEDDFKRLIQCVRKILHDDSFKGFVAIEKKLGLRKAIDETRYTERTYDELVKQVEDLQRELSCRVLEDKKNKSYLNNENLNSVNELTSIESACLRLPQKTNTIYEYDEELCSKLEYLESLRKILIIPRSKDETSYDDSLIIDTFDSVLSRHLDSIDKVFFYIRSRGITLKRITNKTTNRMISNINNVCKIFQLMSPTLSSRFDVRDVNFQRLLLVIVGTIKRVIITLASFLNIASLEKEDTSNNKACNLSLKVLDKIYLNSLFACISRNFKEAHTIIICIICDALHQCTNITRKHHLSLLLFNDELTSCLVPKNSSSTNSRDDDYLKAESLALIYIHILNLLLDPAIQNNTLNSTSPRISDLAITDIKNNISIKCKSLLENSITYVSEALSSKIFEILLKIDNSLHPFNFETIRIAESIVTQNMINTPNHLIPSGLM